MMMIYTRVISGFVLLAVVCAPGFCTKSPRNFGGPILAEILDDLDLRSDNRVRPGYGDKPLEIHAFAFIRNIVGVDEGSSTITVSFLLMQMWSDARLSFEGGEGKGSISEILIDNPEFMSRFWSPDTFIINEVGSRSRVGDTHFGNNVIKLTKGGDVLKTSRTTVTLSCPMRFENYPLHAFDCDLEMESFGHKTDDIVYMWRNGSRSADISKIDGRGLAGRTGYSVEYVNTHSQQSYLDTGGSYSRLVVRFHFKKLWLRHAITFFIPVGVLAGGSLVSLWAVSFRFALCGLVVNFITAGIMVLLGCLEYSTNPVLAVVPFFTPVDFHFGICISAVFASIVYHGVSLCCMKSRRTLGRDKVRRDGQRCSESTLAEDMGSIMRTRDRIKRTNPAKDQDVSYYESYDVTEDCQVEDLRGGVVERGDVSEHENNHVPCFITASLRIIAWMSAVSFIVAQFLLWYVYGVVGMRNGGIGIFS